jgi:predicted nucleic acid-binding protein
MKAYWDSSALVEAYDDADLQLRLKAERGFSRSHSLAEVFSALTGKLQIRISPDDAALVLEKLAAHLDFVELTPREILAAFKQARSRGVRGGRIHDYLHAVAAEKAGAALLLTLDKNDFEGLAGAIRIEQV